MKKHILALGFLLCIVSAMAQTDTTRSAPPEKAKTHTALWISLGVVFFCVFLAVNAKKMKKKKE